MQLLIFLKEKLAAVLLLKFEIFFYDTVEELVKKILFSDKNIFTLGRKFV